MGLYTSEAIMSAQAQARSHIGLLAPHVANATMAHPVSWTLGGGARYDRALLPSTRRRDRSIYWPAWSRINPPRPGFCVQVRVNPTAAAHIAHARKTPRERKANAQANKANKWDASLCLMPDSHISIVNVSMFAPGMQKNLGAMVPIDTATAHMLGNDA